MRLLDLFVMVDLILLAPQYILCRIIFGSPIEFDTLVEPNEERDLRMPGPVRDSETQTSKLLPWRIQYR